MHLLMLERRKANTNKPKESTRPAHVPHLQNLWLKGRELILYTLIFNGATQQKNVRIGNVLLHFLVSDVLGEHQAMDQRGILLLAHRDL